MHDTKIKHFVFSLVSHVQETELIIFIITGNIFLTDIANF